MKHGVPFVYMRLGLFYNKGKEVCLINVNQESQDWIIRTQSKLYLGERSVENECRLPQVWFPINLLLLRLEYFGAGY